MKAISLTQGKITIVDDEDFNRVSTHKWYASESATNYWYAQGWVNGKTIPLSRFLLNPPVNMMVDHKNGDTLDNRRENLRICTHHQNLMNCKSRRGTSIYKGVDWHNHAHKWRAGIRKDGKSIHIGLFKSEIKAAVAYNRMARELFGEFAKLNWILA